LITAKSKAHNKYQYRLYSNVQQILFPYLWMDASGLSAELQHLSQGLKQYDHNYIYEGDKSLEAIFSLQNNNPALFTRLKPFYKTAS